jgi:hypothetical protein
MNPRDGEPEEWQRYPEEWKEPFEVDQKLLQEFGVTAEPFQNALQLARLEWAACTENDPLFLPGTIFWGKGVRFLRDGLLPAGWTKDDPRNLSLTISPDGATAIAVATGDQLTGNITTTDLPKSKSGKGNASKDAIAANQGELFPWMAPAAPPKKEPSSVKRTWWFLIRIEDGEVFGELLLPFVMDDDGRIVGKRCKERIVIPIIGGEGGPGGGVRRRGPEPAPEEEVKISRREA